LFVGGRFSWFHALLNGDDVYEGSLPPPPRSSIVVAPLPPVLNIQLENAYINNKNQYVFSFYFLVVYKRVFCEIYINFLNVEHTHNDIDTLFGRWSWKLKANNYPILPLLMTLFMDTGKQLVIPHLIEEVPNFKALVDGYLYSGNDTIRGHTNAQRFKFYNDSGRWPMMQYKLLCIDNNWLQKKNEGV
jgi:hypothetical protein